MVVIKIMDEDESKWKRVWYSHNNCNEVKYIICKEMHRQTFPIPMKVDHGDDFISYVLKRKNFFFYFSLYFERSTPTKNP